MEDNAALKDFMARMHQAHAQIFDAIITIERALENIDVHGVEFRFLADRHSELRAIMTRIYDKHNLGGQLGK